MVRPRRSSSYSGFVSRASQSSCSLYNAFTIHPSLSTWAFSASDDGRWIVGAGAGAGGGSSTSIGAGPSSDDDDDELAGAGGGGGGAGGGDGAVDLIVVKAVIHGPEISAPVDGRLAELRARFKPDVALLFVRAREPVRAVDASGGRS